MSGSATTLIINQVNAILFSTHVKENVLSGVSYAHMMNSAKGNLLTRKLRL